MGSGSLTCNMRPSPAQDGAEAACNITGISATRPGLSVRVSLSYDQGKASGYGVLMVQSFLFLHFHSRMRQGWLSSFYRSCTWLHKESVAELGLQFRLSRLWDPYPYHLITAACFCYICPICQAEGSLTTQSHFGPWGEVSQRVNKWATLQELQHLTESG